MLKSAIPIVDIDTHWVEPADLWTSRAPAKYKGRVIHLKEERNRSEAWYIGDKRIAIAGPSVVDKNNKKVYELGSITRVDGMADSCSDSRARLKMMDDQGVDTQVIYPNVIGFGTQTLMNVNDDIGLRHWHVTTYNDALAEMQKVGKGRLLPQAALPLWDIDASLKELRRAREKLGLTGVVMSDKPADFGQKPLSDPVWEPFFATCQDLQLPINFHIASGTWEGNLDDWWSDNKTMVREDMTFNGPLAVFQGVKLFLNNSFDVMNLILHGILEKFPRLKFVSVESGASWIPFVIQSMEFYWRNIMTSSERARLRRTPREAFIDQVYASYWFENKNAIEFYVKEFGADNLMFETDFPHPNSLYADDIPTKIEETLSGFDEETKRKICYKNAERVYGISVSRAAG